MPGNRLGLGFRGIFRVAFRVGFRSQRRRLRQRRLRRRRAALRSFKPPITAAVFSVFAPKSIFRSRRIVVFLSPTASNRYDIGLDHRPDRLVVLCVEFLASTRRRISSSLSMSNSTIVGFAWIMMIAPRQPAKTTDTAGNPSGNGSPQQGSVSRRSP